MTKMKQTDMRNMTTNNTIHKAPDKQRICVFTQLKQCEYAIKLIYVRTKTQTKFLGMQCKKFQKRNIRICNHCC